MTQIVLNNSTFGMYDAFQVYDFNKSIVSVSLPLKEIVMDTVQGIGIGTVIGLLLAVLSIVLPQVGLFMKHSPAVHLFPFHSPLQSATISGMILGSIGGGVRRMIMEL